MSRFQLLKILTITTYLSAPALADEPASHSPMLSGPLGLNTIPSARMDEAGTVRASLSTHDPYSHGILGMQLADPLYVQFRQTAKTSSLQDEAERLYPGIDLKLRLLKESEALPEIAIGLQSAIGHKRMAGEYIAASKRYKNLDFTAGMGWGRFGSAAHFDNPLRHISSHFGKNRIDEEMPNEPVNWFTDADIGFFGGLEYFTPINGLSIKADYGADRYSAEAGDDGFSAPPPWALGLSYSPNTWFNAGIGVQGLEKITARLSLSGKPSAWPFSPAKAKSGAPLAPKRAATANPHNMVLAAQKNGISVFALKSEAHKVAAQIALENSHSTPEQLGLAATALANHAGQTIEEITFTPHVMNLRGPSISIMRSDLENALRKSQGSAAEIWHNTSFKQAPHPPLEIQQDKLARSSHRFKSFRLSLDNQISLSEEDSGTLHRSSLIARIYGPGFFGLLHTGTALRLNLHDNLERLRDIRAAAILPVRSNVYDFASQRVSLDRLYATYSHSLTPNLHMALTGGYLEEMYGGIGGEILYRPFGKRFALGAESWLAMKRDPLADMNMGFNGDSLLSGHINGWYDLNEDGLTVKASIGRFLAEDFGAELALGKTFENGARIDAYVTMSDMADFDLFGGTTHAYHGVRLSLPLGSVPYVPQGSTLNIKLAPFGRDIGQRIDNPVPLYEATEAFSKDHLARHWGDILPMKK